MGQLGYGGTKPAAGAADDGAVVHNTGDEPVDGAKTFNLPVSAPDAIEDDQLATLGQLNSATSAISGSYGAPAATIAALRAIDSTPLPDRQIRLCEGAGALYRFDTTGTGADDGDGTIKPTVGPGRWFKVQQATVDHEGLTSLQGGGAGDHVHLTAAQAAALAADLPTAGQKAALAGSSGAPADGNRYVTAADSRLTNARTPTVHATSHASGGTDVVTLAASQVTGLVAALDAAAVDATVVHNAGDETITGIKTFSSAPVVPAPTHASNPVRNDDARLTDARTPTAHATSHVTGGGDVIPAAVTGGNAGLMTGADKTKLDGLAAVPPITLLFGAVGAVAVGLTRYLYPGAAIPAVLEIQVEIRSAILLSKIAIQATTAPGTHLGVPQTDTYTVRKNGSDTDMVVALTGSATENHDDTKTVALAVGDKLSIKGVFGAFSLATDPIITLQA